MHGWRVSDSKHMRMSGYPAKPRSLSWSPDGHWLATSGAEACVVWPFEGKDGPMGKPPRECGVRPVRVSQVAFHPRAGVLALGYDDGFVLMVRMKDNSEILIRREDAAGGAVSALGLERDGHQARLRHPQRRRRPADPADAERSRARARLPSFPHRRAEVTWPCACRGGALGCIPVHGVMHHGVVHHAAVHRAVHHPRARCRIMRAWCIIMERCFIIMPRWRHHAVVAHQAWCASSSRDASSSSGDARHRARCASSPCIWPGRIMGFFAMGLAIIGFWAVGFGDGGVGPVGAGRWAAGGGGRRGAVAGRRPAGGRGLGHGARGAQGQEHAAGDQSLHGRLPSSSSTWFGPPRPRTPGGACGR